jgi:SpoVK/Ycf46/Vps4 family AAA+-type ATPase
MNFFNELTTRIEPRSSWRDLHVPSTTLSQLKDIYRQGEVLLRSHSIKGVNILFSGPTGTGKSISAEVMANELGLALYRVDLAAIVNKFIGETEKNLNVLFNSEEGEKAILYFDEADALFGKRTAVQDAHDRYANLDTGYLLQLLENHPGLVILATNSKQAIDSVFYDAMRFRVDFPSPIQEPRRSFWRRLWQWLTSL